MGWEGQIEGVLKLAQKGFNPFGLLIRCGGWFGEGYPQFQDPSRDFGWNGQVIFQYDRWGNLDELVKLIGGEVIFVRIDLV